jgi:hypothetical protein
MPLYRACGKSVLAGQATIFHAGQIGGEIINPSEEAAGDNYSRAYLRERRIQAGY